MAFSKISINSNTWTLIGDAASPMTFQNVGQQQIYVNTSGNTTPTSDTLGLVYDIWQGEFKIDPSTLTIAGGSYVWAKTVTGNGSVIVDV